MHNRSAKRGHSSQTPPNVEISVKVPKMDGKTEILPTPVKSASDRKEYRLIQLSNGLKALLVDSTAATSVEEDVCEDDDDALDGNLVACSLMVDVGSFSDPRKIQVRQFFSRKVRLQRTFLHFRVSHTSWST